MKKTPMLCAATAAALLIAPAAASAKGTVTAGPLKVKGYSLSLIATDGSSDSLMVSAVKRAGQSEQMHSWSFKTAKVTVSGAKATIKGNLGPYGSINAKVKTSGKAHKGGCAGSFRAGRLTGKTKLVLDSTYFKTVKPKSLKAQVIKAGTGGCPTGGSGGAGQAPGNTSGVMLSSTADTPDGTLSVTVVKTGSKVTHTVMRTDAAAKTGGADVFHMITARTGASGMTVAPDLQNASAIATGPFLTGQLAFAGEPMGTMASGTTSGDYAAKFDSIGQQSLPEGTDAILMQH